MAASVDERKAAQAARRFGDEGGSERRARLAEADHDACATRTDLARRHRVERHGEVVQSTATREPD
jgi:hypothetical protein